MAPFEIGALVDRNRSPQSAQDATTETSECHISGQQAWNGQRPSGSTTDSTTSHEILELLRRSVEQYGQTIVMVTHDARAAAIANRVLFLADGTIVRELGECDAHTIHSVLDELAAA